MADVELLTTAEVARLLDEKPRQVARRVSRGELDVARKLPGRSGAYLFHRDDVERLREEIRRERAERLRAVS